jgi:hypothetical protein
VERYIHFNKKKPETPNTNQTKTTHISNPATTKSARCCPSESQPTPSLLLRRFDCLQTHPSGEIQMRIQQNNSNVRRCQHAAIATIALDTGRTDRGSPQSTWNSPTSGVLQTVQQKENRKRTNETKTTHIPNSATTKSAWCCPSARHPTPSLLHR